MMVSADLDDYILGKMKCSHIPGLAAVIIKQRHMIWSKGFGWADIDGKIEMTPDTLQNIGSISKTFVSTAVMQLQEKGTLELEDCVDKHLDFSIQNPIHPDSPFTFIHFLTHCSSISDGSAYARGYGCGNSPVSLED
jgi:CubicO group peptidase (beta-lactamase class C family)